MMPVGQIIVTLEVEGEGNEHEITAEAEAPVAEEPAPASEPAPEPAPEPARVPEVKKPAARKPASASAPRAEGEKPIASPAVRKRAMDAGIKLQYVHGTGPAGRITHEDLDAYIEGATAPVAIGIGRRPDTSVEEIKVIGLRRKIAQRMQDAKQRIPHITYVEEIDVTELESLRAHMNSKRTEDQPKLTILSFIMKAMCIAIRDYPKLNSHYDDANDTLFQYGGVHLGMACPDPRWPDGTSHQSCRGTGRLWPGG